MSSPSPLSVVILCLGLVVGCQREDPIVSYEAPKDPPMPQLTGGPGIQWTLPANWKVLRVNNQMTYAAFHVADGLKPLTVSELPAAGGATLPNVNRWEGQLGLPPSSEVELHQKNAVTPMKINGQHDAQFVNLLGPDPAPDGGPRQRMLAAIVPAYDRVWFFKLQGPTEKVEPLKDPFLNFIQTIKLPPGANAAQVANLPQDAQRQQLPADHPPIGASPGAPNNAPAPNAQKDGKIEGLAAMKLPEGWKIDPNARPMRSATILVPGKDNAAPAEIVVSRLGGNFGGKQANIDRWKGQVNAPPGGDAKAEEVTLDQGPALVYDFEGPEADGKARKRQYVFQTNFPKAQTTWFFRLIGPHDTVTAAKPAFDQFVRSLKFEQ